MTPLRRFRHVLRDPDDAITGANAALIPPLDSRQMNTPLFDPAAAPAGLPFRAMKNLKTFPLARPKLSCINSIYNVCTILVCVIYSSLAFGSCLQNFYINFYCVTHPLKCQVSVVSWSAVPCGTWNISAPLWCYLEILVF